MNKGFYLKSCSTCQRILKEINLPDNFQLQDIKSNNISGEDLDIIKDRTGNYESLFSKRAMKYKSLGLKEKNLSDKELRAYIVEEYTFLSRPVFVFDDALFVGNSKKTIESLQQYLNEK